MLDLLKLEAEINLFLATETEQSLNALFASIDLENDRFLEESKFYENTQTTYSGFEVLSIPNTPVGTGNNYFDMVLDLAA